MRGEWMCEGVKATSWPGVKGGEKASESSQGERASVDETLDSRLT